jgi:hypothetical protein
MPSEALSKDFLSAILTVSVGLEGIFFAAFGIFYQVYATYCIAATPDNPIRASVVKRLRLFCRVLAAMISIEAISALWSGFLLSLTSCGAFGLVFITVLPAVAIAVMTIWLACLWME